MERVTALHTLNPPHDDDGHPEGRWLVCRVSPATRAALLACPVEKRRVAYAWSGNPECRGHLRRFLSPDGDLTPQGEYLALVQPDTP